MITNSMLFTNETDAALFKIALQETNTEFVVNRARSRDNPEKILARFTVVVNPLTALQHGWKLARMVDFIKLKVANDDTFFRERLEEYAKDFDPLFTVLNKDTALMDLECEEAGLLNGRAG